MADWVTISSLATAGGTLVLAGATFASVRSGNRSARIAEQTLLAGLRPLIVTSRREDPPQKVGFGDDKWLVAPGGDGAVEIDRRCDLSRHRAAQRRQRDRGSPRLGSLPLGRTRPDDPRTQLDHFHRLTRDLYIAPNDVGFWQGAFRDPSADDFALRARRSPLRRARRHRHSLRRPAGNAADDQPLRAAGARRHGWAATISRHWNVDGADPR